MPSHRPGAALALAALVAACARVEAPPIARVETAADVPRPAPPREPEVPRAPPPAPAVEPPRWPPAPPGIRSAFCLEGVMDTLTDDACYVLPDRPTTTLLVYLPGLMPPTAESPEKRTVETVVANAARRAGVAALVPRGPSRDELAAPDRDPKGLGAWRSWPTDDTAYLRHARRLVEHIQARVRDLEALAGTRFERVLLGGSSAGAYFVSHLVLRGDFEADGYVVVSGGSSRPAPHLSDRPRRPVYVGYGDGDIVGPRAEAFAAEVHRAGWDVRVSVLHTGHGSREAYLDEAFAHFGIVQ